MSDYYHADEIAMEAMAVKTDGVQLRKWRPLLFHWDMMRVLFFRSKAMMNGYIFIRRNLLKPSVAAMNDFVSLAAIFPPAAVTTYNTYK